MPRVPTRLRLNGSDGSAFGSNHPPTMSRARRQPPGGVPEPRNARRATPSVQLGAWLLGALLAVPAGGLALARAFDGLYGQDAYAYFDYATLSVRQSILHASPLEPFFWPPGYPLLVSLASLAIGPSPLAGQLVSLLMGALVPVFCALLVLELWPGQHVLALLAGSLVALSGQLWQSSVVVMADTAGLALATFSAWALARYARRGSLTWLFAASSAIAYATLARWIYGLVAVPFAAYGLWALLHVKPRRPLIHALAAIAVAGVILGPVVGPPLIGLVSHPADPATFAGNFQVYSWSPLNAFRRDFLTADGHLAYPQPNGVYYAAAPANLAFFGPLLAAFILPGLWAARRWSPPSLLLIVGWAALVYAFHAGAPWQNFRFTLAYLPPLAILAAAGVLVAWQHLRSIRLRQALAFCAAVGLIIEAAGAIRLEASFIDRKNEDLALVRWVQAQLPPDADLLSFGPTLTLRHYTSLPTFDLFDLTQAQVSAIVGQPTPHYVLLDEANVEAQWLGQAPYENFLFLRDGPGLQLVGSDGAYTLYRLGAYGGTNGGTRGGKKGATNGGLKI